MAVAGPLVAGCLMAGESDRAGDVLDDLLHSIRDPRTPLTAGQSAKLKELVRLYLTPEWAESNRKRLPRRLLIWMEAYKLTGQTSIILNAVPMVDRIMARAIPPEKAHVCPYTGKRTPYAFQTTGAVDIVSVVFNYVAVSRVARTIVENPKLHRLRPPPGTAGVAASATCLDRAKAYLARCKLVHDYFLNESGWWDPEKKRWSYEKLKAVSRLTGNGGYVAFNRYLMFDLSRWDTARALHALDPVGNRHWLKESREIVESGIELWKKHLIFKDHPKGRYAIFPYRIARRTEDTNHVGADLVALAFLYDDGFDVGRENLRAVSNALVNVAVDAKGRPTRGIDGTATDGRGWRRYIFNTECLVISNAAPDIFKQQAAPWLERIKETLKKKDRMNAAHELVCLLAFQSRYLDGKRR